MVAAARCVVADTSHPAKRERNFAMPAEIPAADYLWNNESGEQALLPAGFHGIQLQARVPAFQLGF